MLEGYDGNPDAKPYFEGLARGVIMVQRCPACGAVQFPPAPLYTMWQPIHILGSGRRYGYGIRKDG